MAEPLQPLTVEERLAALENDVANLKTQLDQMANPKEDWLERITGSMKDYPEFAEVLKYGAEIRRADRPSDDP